MTKPDKDKPDTASASDQVDQADAANGLKPDPNQAKRDRAVAFFEQLAAMNERALEQGHQLLDVIVKAAKDAYGIDVTPLPVAED